MRGKAKCKALKEIRQKIADENDIPYVTRECTYQGDCSGTCPKCEAELKYLENELERRTQLGKKVAVVAVCAGMTLSVAGCTNPFSSNDELGGATQLPVEEQLSGDIQMINDPDAGVEDVDAIDDTDDDTCDDLSGDVEADPNDNEPTEHDYPIAGMMEMPEGDWNGEN